MVDRTCKNCAYNYSEYICLVMSAQYKRKKYNTCDAHATHEEMMAREEAIENYYIEHSTESVRNIFMRRKKKRLKYPFNLHKWFHDTR